MWVIGVARPMLKSKRKNGPWYDAYVAWQRTMRAWLRTAIVDRARRRGRPANLTRT
jgi:hypothetical protein